MVQLTLLEAATSRTVAGQVALLVARWSSRVGDRSLAVEAARVTAHRFAEWGEAELNSREAERIDSYFRAVLRRRVLCAKDPAGARARRRMVVASIAADLTEAGWDERRAVAEARRITEENAVRGGAA